MQNDGGQEREGETDKKVSETNKEDGLQVPFLSKMYFKGSYFGECDLDYQGEATSQTMTSAFFKLSK